MESYDVVIVGAGPAGLRCAEVLGGTDCSVLLLDRKDPVGPKTCAGGLRVPDGCLVLPDSMTTTFGTQHFMLNGEEHSVNLKHPLHVIDRPALGRYQLDLIRRHRNVTVETGVFVSSIENNCVVLNEDRNIGFTRLVGADGSNSVVRKYLGLPTRIYVGIQYVISGSHDKLVWFFRPDLLRSGYGWVFPHKTFVSAGVFFNPNLVSAIKARGALQEFLDNYGLDYRSAKIEGAPVNCLYKGVKFGNIFLAGDAAGLASACTGEGMAYALASGGDIARHILDSAYSFEETKKMIRYKKRQEQILCIFDNLPGFQPSLYKIFISLLKLPAFQKFYSGDF